MTDAEVKHDPDNYRAMSEPHATPDAANEALSAFWDAIEPLRKQHRIQDLLCIAMVNVAYEDGNEHEALSMSQYGDSTKGEMLSAWALGRQQEMRRETINAFMSGKRTTPKAKR